MALVAATACANGTSVGGDDTDASAQSDAAGGDDAFLGSDATSGIDATPGIDATSGMDGATGDAGSGSDAASMDAASGDAGPAAKPVQGEVLITEVMFNPTGTEPDAEWFELHNTTASPKILSGLTLTDGAARTHTIAAGVTIAPNAYAVFVRLRTAAATAKVPTAAILYEYGTGLTATTGIILANGTTGAIKLSDGATTIATVPYGSFAIGAVAKTLELKVLTYAGAQVAASWCAAATPWATGSDNGTPGAVGDCP